MSPYSYIPSVFKNTEVIGLLFFYGENMTLTYSYITLIFYKTEGKCYFFIKKIKHAAPKTYTLSFWHVRGESFVIKNVIFVVNANLRFI